MKQHIWQLQQMIWIKHSKSYTESDVKFTPLDETQAGTSKCVQLANRAVCIHICICTSTSTFGSCREKHHRSSSFWWQNVPCQWSNEAKVKYLPSCSRWLQYAEVSPIRELFALASLQSLSYSCVTICLCLGSIALPCKLRSLMSCFRKLDCKMRYENLTEHGREATASLAKTSHITVHSSSRYRHCCHSWDIAFTVGIQLTSAQCCQVELIKSARPRLASSRIIYTYMLFWIHPENLP